MNPSLVLFVTLALSGIKNIDQGRQLQTDLKTEIDRIANQYDLTKPVALKIHIDYVTAARARLEPAEDAIKKKYDPIIAEAEAIEKKTYATDDVATRKRISSVIYYLKAKKKAGLERVSLDVTKEILNSLNGAYYGELVIQGRLLSIFGILLVNVNVKMAQLEGKAVDLNSELTKAQQEYATVVAETKTAETKALEKFNEIAKTISDNNEPRVKKALDNYDAAKSKPYSYVNHFSKLRRESELQFVQDLYQRNLVQNDIYNRAVALFQVRYRTLAKRVLLEMKIFGIKTLIAKAG